MVRSLLRKIFYHLRALQTGILYRHLLRRRSRPMALPTGVALVIAPHQDDETFGCGGLIATKRRAGIPVSVVFVTDGRASHAPEEISSDELFRRRKKEAIDATAILGVPKSDLYFLNGPDGSLPVLSEADSNRLTAQLSEVIRAASANEIYVPHRRDRHPDHEATYRLTLRAIENANVSVDVFEYPVWLLWRRPVPSLPLADASGAGRLELSPEISQIKDRAIQVYATQLPGMPPGFMPQFRKPQEFYFGPNRLERIPASQPTSPGIPEGAVELSPILSRTHS